MRKRIPAHLIKSNVAYNYDEFAELLGVTVQTVQRWRKDFDLPVFTDSTPHLIMGYLAKSFFAKRAISTKQSCAEDEVFCLRCKAPRKPMGMMADYVSIDVDRGRLETLCEVCEGRCSRLVRRSNLAALADIFDIAINDAPSD